MVLCAMSSLRIFRADFERREATYLGGEIVKGNVIIDTTKEKYITELCFIAKGFAKVYWTEEDGDSNSSSYYNSQEYFQIKGILLKSKDEKSKVKITEGYHEYPFEFLLPSNIPSSFEHNIGYVRYTIELVLQRPWKFDHKYKTAFTVISNLDLNLHREKCVRNDFILGKHGTAELKKGTLFSSEQYQYTVHQAHRLTNKHMSDQRSEKNQHRQFQCHCQKHHIPMFLVDILVSLCRTRLVPPATMTYHLHPTKNVYQELNTSKMSVNPIMCTVQVLPSRLSILCSTIQYQIPRTSK